MARTGRPSLARNSTNPGQRRGSARTPSTSAARRNCCASILARHQNGLELEQLKARDLISEPVS